VNAPCGLPDGVSHRSVCRATGSPTKKNAKRKDQLFLANAARRGNRPGKEVEIYLSEAIMHDNHARYRESIRFYRKVAELARSTGDAETQAAAWNNMGVNYMLLGSAHYADAADCHVRHRELAGGEDKVIANLNLGLAYTRMGRMDKVCVCVWRGLCVCVWLCVCVGGVVCVCVCGCTCIVCVRVWLLL